LATIEPLVINGWTIFAHSLFLKQLEALSHKVEHLRRKDPEGYSKKNPTNQLAAIARLAFEIIPQGPARTDYRQGATLGNNHKHWFRAKFFQQYRLFFRYHQESKNQNCRTSHFNPPISQLQPSKGLSFQEFLLELQQELLSCLLSLQAFSPLPLLEILQ